MEQNFDEANESKAERNSKTVNELTTLCSGSSGQNLQKKGKEERGFATLCLASTNLSKMD